MSKFDIVGPDAWERADALARESGYRSFLDAPAYVQGDIFAKMGKEAVRTGDVFDDLADMFAANGIILNGNRDFVAGAIRFHMKRYTNARKAVDNSGYAVHHIDGNRHNNELSNLTLVKVKP